MAREAFLGSYGHQLFGGALTLHILLNLQWLANWFMPLRPAELTQSMTMVGDQSQLYVVGTSLMLLLAFLLWHIFASNEGRVQVMQHGQTYYSGFSDPRRPELSRLILVISGAMMVPLLGIHWLFLWLGPDDYLASSLQHTQFPVSALWLVMVSAVVLVHCLVGFVRVMCLWWPPRLLAQGLLIPQIALRYLSMAALVLILQQLSPVVG